MTKRQPAFDVPLPTWDPTQTRILESAEALIASRGVHGVTIAELARRARVSRPTIYRHWSDADDVVRAALLRRVASILDQFPEPATTRAEIIEDVLRFSTLFRGDPVYRHLLTDEPEAFTRYTLERVGSSQRAILAWIAVSISAAQDDGSVRRDDPQAMAVMLLLIAQSALLSHGTVSELIDELSFERELRTAIDGLLRP
ncbi:TetR/AcrR family transcriptional regulator [Microbacterium sp. 2MCAF23]|uniref:TetR/AcrR family transcriptional regulator n=1 Tax=Microbacterium sp. 2MCAF23 TaxID=3232985 RepID=UPI003F9560B7